MENHKLEIELADPATFSRGLKKLSKPNALVTYEAIRNLLAVEGVALASELWLKSLGGGLWEFRVGRTTSAVLSRIKSAEELDLSHGKLLIRVFCAFPRGKLLLLLSLYDKGREPSPKKQQSEIAKARKLLTKWERENA
jgi:hypothetical protein